MMSYIARRPCGCVCGAVLDNPQYRRDVAKATAGWIRKGMAVERVTVEAVRAASWSCPTCRPAQESSGGAKCGRVVVDVMASARRAGYTTPDRGKAACPTCGGSRWCDVEHCPVDGSAGKRECEVCCESRVRCPNCGGAE
jgi:hypothetical protein